LFFKIKKLNNNSKAFEFLKKQQNEKEEKITQQKNKEQEGKTRN
jgi:hypothetical protein